MAWHHIIGGIVTTVVSGGGIIYGGRQYFGSESDALSDGNNIESGGERNAIAHTYTSGELANLTSTRVAEVFGDINERLGGNSLEDSWIDQWNNEVGRRLEEWADNNNYDWDQVKDDLVMDAFNSGELITDKNDPRIPDDLDQNPVDPVPGWTGPSDNWPGSSSGRDDGGLFDAISNWISDLLSGAFDDPLFSPLIIDLDNDGIELVSLADSGAFFDMNADGFAELTGWVQSDDALLALDVNGNGIIDNITELFGDENTDGFIQLAALDSNGDGFINNQDAEFSNLLLWNDLDGDGFSDEGELQAITNTNIEYIDLDYASVTKINEGHSISSQSTVTMSDDSEREIVDVWFQHDPSTTFYTLPSGFSFNENVIDLPNLKGYGTAPDLWVAMSDDAGLLASVNTLAGQDFSSFDYATFRSDVEAIVLEWLGVDGVNPASRGSHVDARHLEGMEVLMGQPFDADGGPNPSAIVGEFLEQKWEDMVDQFAARMLVQMPNLAAATLMQDLLNDLLDLQESGQFYSLVFFIPRQESKYSLHGHYYG